VRIDWLQKTGFLHMTSKSSEKSEAIIVIPITVVLDPDVCPLPL
jgi:hypothetical protein